MKFGLHVYVIYLLLHINTAHAINDFTLSWGSTSYVHVDLS